MSHGRLMFSANESDTVLGPGGIALLRRESAFALSTPTAGYRGVFVSIFDNDNPAYYGPSVALYADSDLQTVGDLMAREVDAPGEGSATLLRALGTALAWKAIRLASTSHITSSRPDYTRYWAERVRQSLDATVYSGQTARDALSSLSLSYRQLARHFRGITGKSPKQYQIEARIREAQRLLRQTRLPITAIAFELGYPSSQHFATQFAKIAGMSASEYRASAPRLPEQSPGT